MGTDDAKRIQVWRKAYGWGPTKIEGHLNAHYQKHIPHNRIYQLLKEKKLNKPIGKPRKTWGKKRWERLHSMTLWQVDWKDINTEFDPMLTFYDDHSRYVTGSKRFTEATMSNTIKLAKRTFKRHGIPEQMLSDNGSQFTNNRSDELTEFEQLCVDFGIQVIHSTKQRPTTLGKLENFHGCYDAEIWVTKGNHAKFVRYWNNKRPCGAIDYLYPVEVFYRDRKKTPINSG
jgi:transposase InsO family protein